MIANEHFRWPPAIPTLPRGRPRGCQTQEGKAPCREPRRYRPLRRPPRCRRGRASGDHLWSPDCRSRVDRLESALTSIQRRSEMKALWCGSTALGLVAAVSLSPAMAPRPKPSGGNTWPGISQRVVPSSLSAATTNTHYEWRSGYDPYGIWRGHWVLVQGWVQWAPPGADRRRPGALGQPPMIQAMP